MTPCEQLEYDLKAEDVIYWETFKEIIIRFILGLFNLDWLYDILVLKVRSFRWYDLFNALALLDIALVIKVFIDILREAGLSSVGAELVKRIGPWALAIWAAVLLIDVGIVIYRLTKLSDDYKTAVKVLYDTTDCQTKNEVFRRLGVNIPQ